MAQPASKRLLTEANAAARYVRTVNGQQIDGNGNVTVAAANAPQRVELLKASSWGSSTAQRLGPDISDALTPYGINHFAGGYGSWQMSHIAAATGSRPLIAQEFTIPASGGVNITPTNMPEQNNTPATITILGAFAGISGTLSSPADSAVWTFTRATAGTATVVPAGTPFIPTKSAEFGGGITILNVGKNTLNVALMGWDVARVTAMTDEMVQHFGGAARNVLVMGHFVDTGKSSGDPTRARIVAYNDYCRTKYGDRFLDLSAYLTGSQVWTDMGITPTSDDLAEQATGNKPPSLAADAAHLTQAADLKVAQLIKNRLLALGWLTALPVTPVPTDTLYHFTFDHLVGTVANGADVTSVAQQSGTLGLTLNAAWMSAYPSLAHNAVNGHAALDFNGALSEMINTPSATDPVISGPVTYSIVVRLAPSATTQRIIGSGATTPYHSIRVGSSGNVQVVNTAAPILASDASLPFDQWAILTVVIDGANSYVRINKGTPKIGETGVGNTVGVVLGSGKTSTPMTGRIAAVTTWNRHLSDSEITAVIDDRAATYGIAA